MTVRGALVPRLAAPLLGLAGVVMRGPARSPEGAPLLHVTLDDGPCPEGTPLLLDVLAREGAHATCFLRGDRAAERPDLVRDVLGAGHGLGLHGWAHLDAWRAPREAVFGEMDRAAALLDGLAGRRLGLVRPPYGHLTPGLARWARRAGRRLALWDVLPGDWRPARSEASADALARFVLRHARPGSVLVLHDGAPAALAARVLGRVLPRLGAQGWRFPTLPWAP